MKNHLNKNHRFRAHWAYYVALAIAIAATAGTLVYSSQSQKKDDSSIVVQHNSNGAGSKGVDADSTGEATSDSSKTDDKPTTQPTATSSSSPLITPAGQILNTNKVSLSATSGQLIPNMESTVLQGSPNAAVAIVASLNGGSDKTVASPGSLNSSGQYPQPINWSAKDNGLTPGSWNVRIKTSLNGQTAYSQPAILEVSP